MFGYVFIDKPEMKIKDYAVFKCYYCGLCKALKREYDQMSRLVLNYDCAFLYVLAASLDESPAKWVKERCVSSPIKPKYYALDAGAEYAAAVNVMLAVQKYGDDIRDEKKPLSWTLARLYAGAYKKAKARFPKVAASIEQGLKALYALESQGTEDMDLVAHQFAQLLGDIFAGIGGGQERILKNMGYNIGRWIYLIDAYDDIEKDLKAGGYNPYIAKYGREKAADKKKYIQEEAAFSLNVTISQGIQAYDLLRIEKNKAILDNIMYHGLAFRTKNILDGNRKKIDGSI